MSRIAVVSAIDVARTLREAGLDVLECPDGVAFESRVRAEGATLDAVVVGDAARDPIQTTQRAYRIDPTVSVVLLAAEEQRAPLRHALMFTPFIGSDVECVAPRTTQVVDEIVRAAVRTSTRRASRLRVFALNEELARPKPNVAQRREQFTAHIFDAAPIGILALDGSRRVVGVNQEAERLIGATERALLGVELTPATLGANATAWDAMFSSDQDGETTFRRSDGTSLSARAGALSGTNGDGCLLVLRDVTDQVRAAEAREAAARQAEEANRLKDEFIAMISHELRTPLNAIVGWVQLLRRGAVPPAKIEHALEVVERNASAQVALVEDLLDVSRIMTGNMRLDVADVSVTELVREAAESLRVAIDAKGVVLDVDVPASVPPVAGDAARLRQVAWNVLSNAVKFTPGGRRIRVTAGLAGSMVEVRVTDEGEGIDPASLPFIFDPFRQADGSTTRRHGGLGLGLAIARRIVELHGGRLAAASEGLGKGATFAIALPVVSRRVRTPQGERAAVGGVEAERDVPNKRVSLDGLRVLVVEDDDDARELVVVVLTTAGAQVVQTSSAASARAALEAGRFDVVVSDIAMPDEDGCALIASIRAREGGRGAHVPAIALSAFAAAADRDRALAAGFDHHLTKPVDASALLNLVAQIRARPAST